jgi:hypothetical protein
MRDVWLRAAQDGEELHVEEEGFTLRASGEHVWVEDTLVPTFVEFTVGGLDGQPTTFARVEVRDGVPALVELRFTASADERDIRQADLRAVQVRALVEDLVAGLSFPVRAERDGSTTLVITDPDGSPPYSGALKTMQRARSGKATRTITPELLARVAQIYRANVPDRPTLAVQRAFMVSPRMASEYVQRARRAGLLPPTSPGKKKA